MGADALVTNQSAAAAKIHLFRSLFRGREDVYPRRFESRKTGRAGYQPACANDWVRGLCDKPRTKCAACSNRRVLPVTDEVIRQHLSGLGDRGGEFVMGIYPMLADETCCLLAIDLDGEAWQEDAKALRETCQRLELPVALERSRSGKGGHLWFFFAEALPANVARNLGSHLLTETMEGRPEVGLASYDRLFPNQDTLPKGGFGNLIALPLQKRPRAAGNTVFLDQQFQPYADQWAFLSSVKKISRAQAGALAREAERRGRITGVRLALDEEDDDLPWTAPPSRQRKEPRSRGHCPRRLNWCWATKSTLPRSSSRRGCATGCCGWRHSRILSSTGHKACGCPRSTSRASFIAQRMDRNTWRCPADAWKRRKACSPLWGLRR